MALKKITLEKMQDFLNDINGNFSQTPPLIISNAYPNETTVAQKKGQLYFNTTDGSLYVCSNIIDNTTYITYVWNQVSGLNKYKVLTGNTEPSNNLRSDGVGQLYINILNNRLYLCTGISRDGTSSSWVLIATGNIFPIIVSQDGIIENRIAKGIGQLLMDFSTNTLYMCVARELEDDIWCPINTGKQQILYSTNKPATKDENIVWIAKNKGVAKNTDGETTPIPLI